jgi:hypothetical protein
MAMEDSIHLLPSCDTNQVSVPHIVIPIDASLQEQTDPRNVGDYSLWYTVKYKYSERFIDKKSGDVSSILQTMITDPQAPIQQRENLERLRKVISDCALHESLAPLLQTEIRQRIYLTCLKDKVVELQLGLQAEKELVADIVVKDLAQQTYEQQLKDITAADLELKRIMDCRIYTKAIVGIFGSLGGIFAIIFLVNLIASPSSI